MRSGLARLGYTGMLALLLIPVLLAIGVRLTTRAYCTRANQAVAAQTATLSQLLDMECVLRQSRTALQSLTGTNVHDLADTGEVSRWLLETAAPLRLQLQNQTIKKDPAATSLNPAFTAAFRMEQPVPQLILFLHLLHAPSHLVVYDAVRLRLGDPGQPRPYVADVTLHIYPLAALQPSLTTSLGATVAPEAEADNQLLASVRQKASAVMRMTQAASHTLNLSEYIAALPIQTETPTNGAEHAASSPPSPGPVLILRGVSLSNQRPLALINKRWWGVGDVVTNGLRISKIEANQVVLVDTQGASRVITLFQRDKP